jgi:ubiquitin-like protein ATG12
MRIDCRGREPGREEPQWKYPKRVTLFTRVIIIHGDVVVVFFRPVGSAPLLKQTKFKISSASPFQSIQDFLQRHLWPTSTSSDPKSDNQDQQQQQPLYLYINSSFSPAADEIVGNLYACFSVDNTLIVNYSLTPAWS